PAEGGDPPSRRLWTAQAKGWWKRRELEPAKTAVERRPKREMSPFGHVLMRYVVTARDEGHGVEHRPKVAENGHTERGNSVSLFPEGEQATGRMRRGRRMAQEAKALGNAGDRLT
ncbi:MAG: hypothetical protein ACUVX8_18760, partial [Candidatus Zipacnadales bacterium]